MKLCKGRLGVVVDVERNDTEQSVKYIYKNIYKS